MCDRICGNCKRFKPGEELPVLRDLSHDIFFAADGSQNKIGALELIFALSSDSQQGYRECEEPSSRASALQDCIHEKSFQEKGPQ